MRYGLLVILVATPAMAEVVVSEFFSDPVAEVWTLDGQSCTPSTWNAGGYYFQELNNDGCPAGGDGDAYYYLTHDYNGDPTWFYEVQARTSGDRSEFPFNAPVVVSAFDVQGNSYLSRIANDGVQLFRDSEFPWITIETPADTFHTVRMELYNTALPTYRWFVDGELADEGRAEGQFPVDGAVVAFHGRSEHLPTLNQWNYIRFGNIPDDASADFNSDSQVDAFDHFYIAECIERSAAGEPADPSCQWCDMNGDNTVDCTDWDVIKASYWTGPPVQPSPMIACGEGGIPATSSWGVLVLVLGVLSAGSVAFHRARKGSLCAA